MYKVSIITVNLNNNKGLQETIESVAEQIYADKEYIIIDGGSIDGSVDVIKKSDTKITTWLSEPDLGIYDAMNKGINLASGEWVIFMNSGDIFNDSRTLGAIFENGLFENTDVIYGNTLYKDSRKLLVAPNKIKKQYFFSDTLCHQSLFTNRESFKKIGNYNLQYRFISDREWLLRAKIADLNFQFINEIISIWDPEGLSKFNAKLSLKELKMMRKTYYSIFEITVFFLINKVFNFLKLLIRQSA